jgi:hypothetical protein
MTRSKIRQNECLLKFSILNDNETFEGHRQKKFDTEVNYTLYCNLYTRYFFKIYFNIQYYQFSPCNSYVLWFNVMD